MLALCVYSLAVLAFQVIGTRTPGTIIVLRYADLTVCAMFLADFLWSLYRAENRWRYFVTWGWFDLLSSIPAIDIARLGRLARILRIFRVLRGLRATLILTSLIVQKRAQNTVLAAALAAILLLTFSSIAILHFETGPGANILTANDAVWWAFATITTVGYGDRFPVTPEGRLVAVLLMSAGVGLFGIFSGFVASWFIGEDSDRSNSELVALREEMARLREALPGQS